MGGGRAENVHHSRTSEIGGMYAHVFVKPRAESLALLDHTRYFANFMQNDHIFNVPPQLERAWAVSDRFGTKL